MKRVFSLFCLLNLVACHSVPVRTPQAEANGKVLASAIGLPIEFKYRSEGKVERAQITACDYLNQQPYARTADFAFQNLGVAGADSKGVAPIDALEITSAGPAVCPKMKLTL